MGENARGNIPYFFDFPRPQIYTAFLETPDIDPTLAYIQYMKFARRAEGTVTNIVKKFSLTFTDSKSK